MYIVSHGKLAYALGMDDMFDPTDSQESTFALPFGTPRLLVCLLDESHSRICRMQEHLSTDFAPSCNLETAQSDMCTGAT